MTQNYGKLAFVGLGLIASSMFWAMKRANMSTEVYGFARSAATRGTARKIGPVSYTHLTLPTKA